MFAIALISVSSFYSCNSSTKDDKVVSPPSIEVVKVLQKDLPIYKEFVGQIYGYKDIPIRARVEGFLESIEFTEGAHVDKGQLLYTIDSQPFQADVAAAKSKVAEAEVMLVNANNELARYRPLAETKAVSQSDVDAVQATRDASEASLNAAKANLEMSEINLSYATMKSPIKGVIGKTNARIGEFVGKDPNPVILNTVSRLDTVRVQFFLTESQYLLLARTMAKRTSDMVKQEDKAHIELILADGSTHPFEGMVDFINREVDAETGAILIQATFPNPSLILRPGQFARVKVRMKLEKGAMLVPQRAIKELQGQYSAFVVNKENKIESRQIKISDTFADYYVVSEGLLPEDKLVLEGIQKVRSGMEIVPVITEFTSQSLIK
jgi:membrane fusion protein (multidrug efflux system)